MLKLEISNLKIQIFLETLVPFFKNEPVKTTFGKKKSFNFHKLHMFFKYHIFQKKIMHAIFINCYFTFCNTRIVQG